VGLTVVAFGTSAPELAVSLRSALGGEPDLAVGNVVGSNIFNVAAILGVTALVRPFDVEASVLSVEYPAAFLLSLILLPMVWSRSTIQRAEGVVLVLTYVGLGAWVFTS
jgi:cation:H+ antiporter